MNPVDSVPYTSPRVVIALGGPNGIKIYYYSLEPGMCTHLIWRCTA